MENLHESFDEYRLFEIGDASSKPFKVKGPSPKQVVKAMIKAQGDRTSDDGWFDDDGKSVWTFSGDKGTDYTIEIAWNTQKKLGKPRRFIKNPKTYRKYQFRMNIGFYAKVKPSTGTEFNIGDEDDKERTTNLGEQYRVLATVVDTAIPVINEVTKDFSIDTIYIIPKADKGEPESIHNKRGKFYLAYLKKQIKKIKDKVTITADKYIGGYLIRGGHISGSGGGDIGYIRNESVDTHLHKEWQDDVQMVKKDFETDKQTIKDGSKLKVGDYAIHKHQQSLGPGQIMKLHPTSHADLHFATDLKSSTIDGDDNYKKFTFHISDLIPVIGTSDT